MAKSQKISVFALWRETYAYLFRAAPSIVTALIPALVLLALIVFVSQKIIVDGNTLLAWSTGSYVGEANDSDRQLLHVMIALTYRVILLFVFTLIAVPLARHIFAGRKVTLMSFYDWRTVKSFVYGAGVVVIAWLMGLVLFMMLITLLSAEVFVLDGPVLPASIVEALFFLLIYEVAVAAVIVPLSYVPVYAAVRNETGARPGWNGLPGNFWRVVFSFVLVMGSWRVLEFAILSLLERGDGTNIVWPILFGGGAVGVTLFLPNTPLIGDMSYRSTLHFLLSSADYLIFAVFAAVSFRRLVVADPAN